MVSEPSTMELEKSIVRLSPTNFPLWEFQFRVYVEGKGLLGILDGTTPRPAETAPAQAIAAWNQNDARVRSVLLSCVDPTTCLSLRLFPTANRMWRHLQGLYSTVNAARQFELQMALARLTQGENSVTEYFNSAQELWTEQDMLNLALRPNAEMTEDMLAERQRERAMQFLMKLRPKFEPVRATLLNQDRLQFDGLLSALVREEIRLRTQSQLDMRPGEGETIIAAAAVQGVTPGHESVYAVGRPHFQQRIPVTELECHHCRERGHVQNHCKRKNYCVYCKRSGHIILECRTKERNNARYGGYTSNLGPVDRHPAAERYAARNNPAAGNNRAAYATIPIETTARPNMKEMAGANGE
ncbi:unnamed protein product [Linum trigynum]|uniref:Retrotransposon gag domain-containing protein n=1 Tax=Linum trigynum TaxID=586398 RepID=A0AAV2EWC9_9ROSI